MSPSQQATRSPRRRRNWHGCSRAERKFVGPHLSPGYAPKCYPCPEALRGRGEGPGDEAPRLRGPPGRAVTRALAAVSIGASLGPRERTVRMAWACLRGLPTTDAAGASRVYETAPVGGVARRPFLNAVVTLSTALSPEALADELHRIEHRLGRRPARRWADRVLDLDLLLYDARVVALPGLSVPHPRLAERPFLLAMLAEAWPGATEPGSGRRWTELHPQPRLRAPAFPLSVR